MKHRIITDIKFLYPCIAYDESSKENELVIVAETKLKKIFPVIKKVKGMTHLGEDFWGRSSFKDDKNQYYCEVSGQLYFKGEEDGDPQLPVDLEIEYDYPEYNNEIEKFIPFVDKVENYLLENNLILKNHETSFEINNENYSESLIICKYTILLS